MHFRRFALSERFSRERIALKARRFSTKMHINIIPSHAEREAFCSVLNVQINPVPTKAVILYYYTKKRTARKRNLLIACETVTK